MTYGYDAAARRTATGGSFARAAAVPSFTGVTDAANRLTAYNGTAMQYDANGNLTNDGANSYTWNTRNQLVAISGATTATFTYDPLGRRQSKTINGVASNYVYDGPNIVGEMNSGTIYLTGLGIDETLAMQSDGATFSYLTDALGSTVRLTDGGGNKLVDYTYDLYGNTTADAAINNPFQYAGRENDGTGLYYYRARYYSPTLQRFISQDPIGLRGGIDTYAYVLGNPLSYTDPFGLWPFGLGGADRAQSELPGQLQQLVPALTPTEAKQLANDAIDKAGWGDVKDINSVTPDILHTAPPSNMNDLSAAQQAFLKKFLDKLPSRDGDAVKKVKNACTK